LNTNILLVGVGGQGIILASKLLADALLSMGHDVKMSEIHGMAQRGGTVTTQIKYGDKVYSPCIGAGEADLIVSFEKVEAARYLKQLKKDGTIIVNDYEIYSMPVLSGKESYPENIIAKLSETVQKFKVLNAGKVARDLGNIRAQNIVLLGAVAKSLGLEKLDWEKIIGGYFQGAVLELNLKALHAGMNI
jgi:indolepyruvate ferredoxin oxidoreductase beta subunit